MKGYFIDFDDSFSQTIVSYLKKIGLNFTVINHKDDSLFSIIDNDRTNFVILGPGPGIVSDYKEVYDFLNLRIFNKKKLIGICLGHQMIASFFGFKLKRYVSPLHGLSFSMNFKKPFVKLKSGIKSQTIKVQFYNSWFVEYEKTDYPIQLFSDHESSSISALASDMTLSYQFHPESVGTTCPELFFDAVRVFLYNERYAKETTQIQRGL